MHEGGGPQGLLTTAGGLLFGNDGSNYLCAFDAATGKILWHTWMPTLTTNGPSDVPARWLSVHRGRRAGYCVCVHAESLRVSVFSQRRTVNLCRLDVPSRLACIT